ncbi:tripartite tricarboxylate transporter permease, partial [Puniceibacterium confluentis]
VFGAGLCIVLSKWIAKLTTIRFTVLAPYLFMIIAFAAFQSRQSALDLAALVGIGALGIFLRRFDYSRPAFLIGFVLSNQTEVFVNQAYQIAGSRFRRSAEAGWDYILSPITIGLLILTVVSVVVGIKASKNIRENIEAPTAGKLAPALFLGCAVLYLAVSTWDAFGIKRLQDQVFPLTIGIVSLISGIVLLVRMATNPATDDVYIDLEAGGEGQAPHGLWSTLGWFIGLVVMTFTVGLILALTVFLVAFFRLRGRFGWRRTLLSSAFGLAFILFLANILGRDFPPGLLQAYFDLPWPFT